MLAGGYRAARLMKNDVQIVARRTQCWNDSDDEPGEQRGAQGVREHSPVEGEVQNYRQIGLNFDGAEQMTEPLAEKYARHTANERKKHALGEQRTDQSGARATQSRADSHLALANGSTDQKNVGDVTAGQQEHQASKTKKQT